jgi:pyridoxamine 5'-phosphate oxidase family protein
VDQLLGSGHNYFGSQQLGRLATIGQDGMPHVVPVAYRYNPEATPSTSAGTTSPSAGSFATCSEQAWRRWWSTTSCRRAAPHRRGRGDAVTPDTGGKAIREEFDDPSIQITPGRIVSWGLEDGFQARSVG